MKNYILVIAVVIGILGSTPTFSQSNKQDQIEQSSAIKTENFKVHGKCGMCKARIEGALKDMKGIESANWNVESKMLEVTFDEKLTSLDEINQKIAGVGHDTQYKKASDEQYASLPGCCKYKREKN